jgi:hypothetical protein
MVARVIAAAVAVSLLFGVAAPPLAAQGPATPQVAEPAAPSSNQEPIPASQPVMESPATPALQSAPAESTSPVPVAQPSPVAPPTPVAQPTAAAPPTSVAQTPVAQPASASVSGTSGSHSSRTDVYDVAGGVVTALKAPFNVALCALGGVLGLAIFAGTLGSGYRAAARTVEEGCGGPWVVTGDDLRPERGRPATRLSDLHPGELEGR